MVGPELLEVVVHPELLEGEVGVEDHPLCQSLVGEEGAVEGVLPFQVEAVEAVVVGHLFLVAVEVVGAEGELQTLVAVEVVVGAEEAVVLRLKLSLHSRVTVFLVLRQLT